MALIVLTGLCNVCSHELFLLVLRSECSTSDKALSALNKGYLICVMYCAFVLMSHCDASFYLHDVKQDLL